MEEPETQGKRPSLKDKVVTAYVVFIDSSFLD